jgi:hypothetical protein
MWTPLFADRFADASDAERLELVLEGGVDESTNTGWRGVYCSRPL